VRGRVTITRAAHQAEKLATAFRAAGFTVEHLPLLEVVPPADPRPLERAVYDLESYGWLVFTSANAVDAFLPLTGGALPPDLRVAVVGPATAEALQKRGIEPGLTASRPDAEGLLADLAPLVAPLDGGTQRVLLPQAADARPLLAEGLRRAGAEVAVVIAYDKGFPVEAPALAERLFRDSPVGWVTFTSPRIVRHFVDLFAEGSIGDWERRRPELLAASIGPVTSAELRRQGVEEIAEAETPGDEGLVRAVTRYGRMSAP
jgi:uroporphyrinogen-III synthase